MNKCLTRINNLNLIISYIKYQEIVIVSLVNKAFYSSLNPENNSYINSIFRDITFKKYFNINNKKYFKSYDNDYLDDFQKTKNNWKNILRKLVINSKIYSNKEISDEIYKYFYNHCYMCYQRNENKILEYEYSTLHQIICYDINKKECIISNYYDKYFDINNKNEDNVQIQPLKTGLFFEKELINLKKEMKNYENNEIMKLIINYSFEHLDNEYYYTFNKKKDIKKSKNKLNSVIYFLIWLNHTFLLFISLLYKYVNQFVKMKDPKKIIIEYSKIHSNLINFGLMVNENFNNINIIFNYLQKEQKDFISVENKFNIYNLFFNIMEKNLYQKLKPILNNNIENLFNIFYNEIFDKEQINISFESNNRETNHTELINEDNYIDDNISENEEIIEIEDENEDEDEDKSITDDNYKTNQEIIEEFSNLIVDFSINKDNIFLINNTKIKLSENYDEYENLLLENMLKNIKDKSITTNEKNIFENENTIIDDIIHYLNAFCSFIKKLSIKGEEENQFKLIRRLKLNLFKKSENFIINYLNNLINTYFIYDKETNNYIIKDNIFINSINGNNNINYESYINLLNEIKKNLENNNLNTINDITKEQIIELSNNYEHLDKNKFIKISREILLFFYNQINIYNYEDEKIIDIINKNKNNKVKINISIN